MISKFSKTSRVLRKPYLAFNSCESLKINWNWMFARSPYIFGGILGLGMILFLIWLFF